MVDNYPSSGVGARAIYPSRYMPYVALLLGSKLFRCLAVFISYDLLKVVHIVHFLFLLKAGSAVFLIFLQKPFTSGKRITKHQWFRIGRHAFFGSAINVLWLFGLTLCGPLRTLLLYEHSDLAVIAGASALFTSTGGPAKFRGAVFFLIAVMGLLLFDHDDDKENLSEYSDTHSSILKFLFDHVTNLTGLADHKGGVVLLFATLCMHVGYNSAAKRLSVDIGGAKRLHSLSALVSAVFLAPWAAFVSLTRESGVESWTYVLFPLCLVIFIFVIDYYVDAVCVNHIELARTGRVGAMGTAVIALMLSCVWNHPFITQVTKVAVIAEEHALSGGVIFSFVLFMFATHILTSPNKGSKGSLVGYSASGLPLYSFAGDALHKTSQSVLITLKNGMRQILESSDSRRIFYFLLINLFFTFVELVYGVLTNSLGLISDGFHMLFDCSALVMGLYAAVMSHWKATRIFSYGYDRVEILSGFVNGLFLLVIAGFVFSAALGRLVDPPEINTEKLLTVSVLGLLVNIIGIVSFSHAHTHGGAGHGHSHGGSHGHSHGTGAHHGHSHGAHGHHKSHGGPSQTQQQTSLTHNTNMQGVFLHVLADTLGSVGVIVSTFLIENFDLKIADPLCSIFIAVLIFLSVLPLVKETSLILLLRTPHELQKDMGIALQKVLALEGVLSFRDEHFWRHSTNVVGCTIHVQVKPDVSEQKVIAQVNSIFKEAGVTNITVQVEKESFFSHMSGLGFSTDKMYQIARNMTALNHQDTSDFIKAV